MASLWHRAEKSSLSHQSSAKGITQSPSPYRMYNSATANMYPLNSFLLQDFAAVIYTWSHYVFFKPRQQAVKTTSQVALTAG